MINELYGCEICGKVFWNIESIKEHLTDEEGENGHDIYNEYIIESKGIEEYIKKIPINKMVI